MNKKTATKITFVCACLNLLFSILNLIKVNKQESVSGHEKD